MNVNPAVRRYFDADYNEFTLELKKKCELNEGEGVKVILEGKEVVLIALKPNADNLVAPFALEKSFKERNPKYSEWYRSVRVLPPWYLITFLTFYILPSNNYIFRNYSYDRIKGKHNAGI